MAGAQEIFAGHVPSLNEVTYRIVEAMWKAHQAEWCPNYEALVNATGLDIKTVKGIVQKFKSMGYFRTYKGLMTDDGEVAGSGFGIPNQDRVNALELAMYRYVFEDDPTRANKFAPPLYIDVNGNKYKLQRAS